MFLALGAKANDSTFLISIDRDTVGIEESFKLTYTFENIEDIEMETPIIKGFDISPRIGTSTNVTIANGTKLTTTSYTYEIRPLQKGKIQIPAQKYNDLKSNSLTVWIVDGEGEKVKESSSMFNFDIFGNKDILWEDFFNRPTPQETNPNKENKHDAPVYTL